MLLHILEDPWLWVIAPYILVSIIYMLVVMKHMLHDLNEGFEERAHQREMRLLDRQMEMAKRGLTPKPHVPQIVPPPALAEEPEKVVSDEKPSTAQ